MKDQLPVKTTLLQNERSATARLRRISYQSKRRCSKTRLRTSLRGSPISYQSKRRCSKTISLKPLCCPGSVTSQNDAAPKPNLHITVFGLDQLPVKTTLLQNSQTPWTRSNADQLPVKTTLLQNHHAGYDALDWISYQSKRRCSKTEADLVAEADEISYQSKRRCSKTPLRRCRRAARSVTSQNDAAPKHMASRPWKPGDQLPVKTTLLQNVGRCDWGCHGISYQSKRRCSKTRNQ